MRLTNEPATGVLALRVIAGCCLATLPGCLDGRLDSFEVVSARGGAAGVGSAGIGGSGAAGSGATAGAAGQTNESSLLLDDFEDQDSNVAPDGWWYAIDDRTGPVATMAFDSVTGRGTSNYGVHLAGGPTTGYGSFLGLDLPGPLFDASAFSSLSFWARMEPAGELSVRFQIAEATQYTQPCALDSTWREFRLPMANFRSTGGEQLDPSAVTHLQLWIAGTRPAYHLYVDDVWLLREP